MTGTETFEDERHVLLVARTRTSVARLEDIRAIFNGTNVAITSTVAPGSDFNRDGDVERLLRDLRLNPLPWDEALAGRIDLAIAASGRGPLHEIPAPLLLLSHGAGYGKRGSRARAEHRPDWYCEDLGPEHLMHEGRVVPTTLVLAHRDELRRLARSCLAAVPNAVVAGDVCFDRLRESAVRRVRLRRALGVRDDQRLVLVSSTWGRESLIGRWIELVSRLLAELPADEYRVVTALHPNVWTRHDVAAVLQRLHPPRRAGLLVMPPHEDWRAALVASDLVIGDHGSATLYAAALGRPVLLAAYDAPAVVADSPMALLESKVARLHGDRPLGPQLAAATVYEQIAERTFEHVGGALAKLRGIAFGLLGLAEPAWPAEPAPVPPAAPWHEPAAAHVVVTSVRGAAVELTRFPLAVDPRPAAPSQHVAADAEDAAREHRERADVLYVHDDTLDPARLRWLREKHQPACKYAAAVSADGRCLLVGPAGRAYRLTMAGPPGLDPAVAVSAAYALLDDDADLRRATVRVSALTATLTAEA